MSGELEFIAALRRIEAAHQTLSAMPGPPGESLRRLGEFSEAVARIAQALAALADQHAALAEKLASGRPATSTVSAAAVRDIIQRRRARGQRFPPGLFANPAWDILLDLMAARLENERVSIAKLCIAAAVPTTTAQRWIKRMTDGGLLVRQSDPLDARRSFVDLSDETAAVVLRYLETAGGE